MATPNQILLRIAEIDSRLTLALKSGENTVKIRAELAQAWRDHAEAVEAEKRANERNDAERVNRIGEHGAKIAEETLLGIETRLAALQAPAGI